MHGYISVFKSKLKCNYQDFLSQLSIVRVMAYVSSKAKMQKLPNEVTACSCTEFPKESDRWWWFSHFCFVIVNGAKALEVRLNT